MSGQIVLVKPTRALGGMRNNNQVLPLPLPLMQHVTRRSAQDVHEWEGTFRGQPALYRMTSVIGHVYSVDFPKVGRCGWVDGWWVGERGMHKEERGQDTAAISCFLGTGDLDHTRSFIRRYY